jgi:hypothetical protein
MLRSILIGDKKYDVQVIDELSIELRYAPESSSYSDLHHTPLIDTSIKSVVLHFKSKTLGIQFIKQQSTDILRRSDPSNLIYLWVGYQNSVDLVFFDLSKLIDKANKLQCIGQSVLSFTYSDKQSGHLSSIQVLDTMFGISTFIGFHFTSKKPNETFVTIVPVDAYLALYYGEKVSKSVNRESY